MTEYIWPVAGHPFVQDLEWRRPHSPFFFTRRRRRCLLSDLQSQSNSLAKQLGVVERNLLSGFVLLRFDFVTLRQHTKTNAFYLVDELSHPSSVGPVSYTWSRSDALSRCYFPCISATTLTLVCVYVCVMFIDETNNVSCCNRLLVSNWLPSLATRRIVGWPASHQCATECVCNTYTQAAVKLIHNLIRSLYINKSTRSGPRELDSTEIELNNMEANEKERDAIY